MYSTRRVAGPMATTSTPVASGSSVPACPALCGLTSRCTRLTTSREVSPVGLSMLSRPNMVNFETVEIVNLSGRLVRQIRQSISQSSDIVDTQASEPIEFLLKESRQIAIGVACMSLGIHHQ